MNKLELGRVVACIMHFSPVCNPHDFDYINIQFDCIDIETDDFNVTQTSCFTVINFHVI